MKQQLGAKIKTFFVVGSKFYHLVQQYEPMLRQFVLLIISTILIRGAHIICMPLTLRLVSVVDYGLLALMNSFIAVTSACMGLGLRQCLPLYYFERSWPEQCALVAAIVRIYIVCALPIGIGVGTFFFSYFLADVTVPWYMLWYAAGIALATFFVELCYQLLQYHQQVRYLTILQLVQAAITVIGTIILSVWTSYSFCAPLIAQFLAIGVMTIIALICWYRYAHHTLMPLRTYDAVQQYLGAGLCFLPSMLFGWVLAASQRWLVARYLGLADVGIYAVADSLCQLSHLVCTYAMVGAHMPHMLARFNAHPEHTEEIELENRWIMWGAMAAAGFLLAVLNWCCMPLLRLLVHTTFVQSLAYVFPLLIGSIFLMGAHFLSPLAQYKKRKTYLGCSLIVPAVVNILLGVVLIPRRGLQGAVIAQVGAYMTYFCMNLWYNQRLLKALRKPS